MCIRDRDGTALTEASLTTPTTVADGATTVLTVLDDAAVGLDPDTGEQRWSRALEWDPIAAISALGDRVMVVAMDGTFGSKVIVAVDARDGRIMWERMLKLPSDVDLSVEGATVTVAASVASDC